MGSIFSSQGIDTSKPQSQQVTTGGINSWAQPYVNSMLGATQNLVNQGSAPNALMNQSYAGAANMQTPGQFGQATNIYGQVAPSAMNVGQNYANMATDPGSIQAYMNPYIQQSLAPQLQMLNQQQALQGQQIQGQATGAGAFGGNRETLAQGLNAQNFDLARQTAIGQGYNTAFQQAQQAQQFGANLGLQGLNTANQSAAGLTGAGSAQNAAQMGIANLQNQFGAQQYNLPYQQLQFQKSMLSGLPVGSQTTTGYQAAPNIASQVGGIGLTAIGGLGALNQAGLLKNPFGGASTGTDATSAVSTGPDNSYQYSGSANAPTSTGQTSSQDIVNAAADQGYTYDPTMNAKGGHIKAKRYAKGGIVKSQGSSLADIKLHQLLG